MATVKVRYRDNPDEVELAVGDPKFAAGNGALLVFNGPVANGYTVAAFPFDVLRSVIVEHDG